MVESLHLRLCDATGTAVLRMLLCVPHTADHMQCSTWWWWCSTTATLMGSLILMPQGCQPYKNCNKCSHVLRFVAWTMSLVDAGGSGEASAAGADMTLSSCCLATLTTPAHLNNS